MNQHNWFKTPLLSHLTSWSPFAKASQVGAVGKLCVNPSGAGYRTRICKINQLWAVISSIKCSWKGTLHSCRKCSTCGAAGEELLYNIRDEWQHHETKPWDIWLVWKLGHCFKLGKIRFLWQNLLLVQAVESRNEDCEGPWGQKGSPKWAGRKGAEIFNAWVLRVPFPRTFWEQLPKIS